MMSDGGRNYLIYWVTQSASRVLSEGFIPYATDKRFTKLKPGDELWITTAERGQLFLVGNLRVTRIVSREHAEKELGRKNLWPGDLYALPSSPVPASKRNITGIAGNLRFKSTKDRLQLTNGRVSAQQLQSIRTLTADSVSLLRSQIQ